MTAPAALNRMQLRKCRDPRTLEHDPLTRIAPIYKISMDGTLTLIGTGFWVTEAGHLVTAWHVIADNIGKGGVDEGPIYAMQTTTGRASVPRVLLKTCLHKNADLALSETYAPDFLSTAPTSPLCMTLEEPPVGAEVSTYAVIAADQLVDDDSRSGITTTDFEGLLGIPDLGVTVPISFSARLGFGHVVETFKEGRDSVMLPFPCVQTDIPVYACNSGGPVFDDKGRVFAVNCTSYEGQRVSFHVLISGVLPLLARNIELIPEDPTPRQRSMFELGFAQRVLFDPALPKWFLKPWYRILLVPYQLFLGLHAIVVWKLGGLRRTWL